MIDKDPTLATRIANELAELSPQSAQAELAVLRSAAHGKSEEQVIAERADPVAKSRKSGGRAKTSFQFDRPEGRARCVAASGRLEVRLELDFSTVDRRKLERAVKRMLDEL
jgi:ParB family chromosome partitioning protein